MSMHAISNIIISAFGKIIKFEMFTGIWSNWNGWSNCSSLCGRGVMLRTRVCNSSQICPGNRTEEQECNGSICQGVIGFFYICHRGLSFNRLYLYIISLFLSQGFTVYI